MTDSPDETESTQAAVLRRELLLLAVLVVAGALLLPAVVFLVGNVVFDSYAGDGAGGFYADLFGRLGRFEWAAWLLVLAPYLVLQILRLTVFAWRRSDVGAA